MMKHFERYYKIESKESKLYAHDNPDLLNTQSNIAYCLMEKGRYDEALERFYKIESKESKLYEHDNPELLITQSNIALCLERKEAAGTKLRHEGPTK